MLTGRNAIPSFITVIDDVYHSRLADEHTGPIEFLSVVWFLGNVANNVETKVLHKMNQEMSFIKQFKKMYTLYSTIV